MEELKCVVCGNLINLNTRRRTYCSKECSAKGHKQKLKEKPQMYYKNKRKYDKRLEAELKAIRKKSHLDKDIKDLKKNGEKLGLKSYEYGKYARIKGI